MESVALQAVALQAVLMGRLSEVAVVSILPLYFWACCLGAGPF